MFPQEFPQPPAHTEVTWRPTQQAMPPVSVLEKSQGSDPLMNPAPFVPPAMASSKQSSKANANAPVPGPRSANSEPTTPLGAQSVIAARNGLLLPTQYVPVPMVTVPQPWRPPAPPEPEIPQAPRPNTFVNAFTIPTNPKANGPDASGSTPNMSMGPGFMPGYGPGPPYGPMMDPRMAGPYAPPMMAQGMIPPGMMPPGMMPPGMMPPGMMPQGMMMAQGMYGPNPYMAQMPMGPGMPPQLAFGPMGQPLPPQRPVVQIGYPAFYHGPLPPNPVGGVQGGSPNMPTLPYANPAMDRPGLPMPAVPGAMLVPGSDVPQMLRVMRESMFPTQREWAAMLLADQDVKAHPEIVQALAAGAQGDPAPAVRVCCVRCLARQDLATQPLLGALQDLRNDPDPRVRAEVELALFRLANPQVPANAPGQPQLQDPR
jgi:hypothetical protein